MVGPSGLEPPTSCLSGTRSNLLSYEPMWLVCVSFTLGFFPFRKFLCLPFFSKKVSGGDDGIRTHDPLLAGQVLSQLSYTPILLGILLSPFSSEPRADFSALTLCWHWAIFPGRFQPSIFTTAELNFCVRNGNRWTLCVCNTNYLSNSSSLNIEQHSIKTILSSKSFVSFLKLYQSVSRPLTRSP